MSTAARPAGGCATVGIGQIACASRGSLLCPAVGSCVALALINESGGFAAMAHIFLPKAPDAGGVSCESAGKYADTALPELLRLLRRRSRGELRLRAWLAGGARMFPKGFQQSGTDVGAMNAEAVLALLEKSAIPVYFADLGGTRARNVLLDVDKRVMTIYSNGRPEKHSSPLMA